MKLRSKRLTGRCPSMAAVEVEPDDEEDATEAFVYDGWLRGKLKVLPKKADQSNPNQEGGIPGDRRQHTP